MFSSGYFAAAPFLYKSTMKIFAAIFFFLDNRFAITLNI